MLQHLQLSTSVPTLVPTRNPTDTPFVEDVDITLAPFVTEEDICVVSTLMDLLIEFLVTSVTLISFCTYPYSIPRSLMVLIVHVDGVLITPVFLMQIITDP